MLLHIFISSLWCLRSNWQQRLLKIWPCGAFSMILAINGIATTLTGGLPKLSNLALDKAEKNGPWCMQPENRKTSSGKETSGSERVDSEKKVHYRCFAVRWRLCRRSSKQAKSPPMETVTFPSSAVSSAYVWGRSRCVYWWKRTSTVPAEDLPNPYKTLHDLLGSCNARELVMRANLERLKSSADSKRKKPRGASILQWRLEILDEFTPK